MRVKEESEKPGLKLNIPKMKIMASSPITSWQIDGETVETVTALFFCAQKSLQMVTAALKLKQTNKQKKKTLAPWKKSYDQPRQHIKKQRSWLSSHGRGLGPRDALKKDSRGLCRGAAANPRSEERRVGKEWK